MRISSLLAYLNHSTPLHCHSGLPWPKLHDFMLAKTDIGVRIRGTLGEKDPLKNKAISRVRMGPLPGVSLVLPRTKAQNR